jgi:hypothetical protein
MAAARAPAALGRPQAGRPRLAVARRVRTGPVRVRCLYKPPPHGESPRAPLERASALALGVERLSMPDSLRPPTPAVACAAAPRLRCAVDVDEGEGAPGGWGWRGWAGGRDNGRGARRGRGRRLPRGRCPGLLLQPVAFPHWAEARRTAAGGARPAAPHAARPL